jgi:hypothetical protein
MYPKRKFPAKDMNKIVINMSKFIRYKSSLISTSPPLYDKYFFLVTIRSMDLITNDVIVNARKTKPINIISISPPEKDGITVKFVLLEII